MSTLQTNGRNALATALNNLISAGAGNPRIRIFTTGGSTSGTRLAELTMSKPAFGTPTNGTMAANTITPDSSADATGTAAVAEIIDGDGNLIMSNISCGTSGAELNFNTLAFQLGDNVSISSFSITVPA